MNDKLNKTAICSIAFLEIIDFSKKTATEQIDIKNQLNQLIDHAVIDIPQEDRVIVDTGHGAVIACSGPLEDALEDALFISITIRDEILKYNIHSATPFYVQFGINLGAARVAKDSKAELRIVGEGVDDAQRIMHFANPNQILVSHVYFEMASKLTHEMAQMFEKYEMHALEHDVYAVRLLKDKATSAELKANDAGNSAPGIWQFMASKLNWKYAASTLLGLAALIFLVKQMLTPVEPIITLEQPPVAVSPASTPIKTEAKITEEPKQTVEVVEQQAAEPVQVAQPVEDKPKAEAAPVKVDLPKKSEESKKADELKKAKLAQKKVVQKPVVKAETTTAAKPVASTPADKTPTNKTAPSQTATETHTNTAAKPAESKAEKSAAKEKSGWQTFTDSIKQGSERKCTQAEISMNQCPN